MAILAAMRLQMGITTIGTPALWIGFTVSVLALLALDLGVFHRRAHVVGMKEAAIWSAVWISSALVFNVLLYAWFGSERALEFATGYLIEKALAVDNLFVFLVIFSYFAVQPKYQHRVLFWGILGALFTRAAFIFTGAALLEAFHWTMYVFGGFLVLTGLKLLFRQPEDVHPERNPVFQVFRTLVPCRSEYDGQSFVVRHGYRWFATPLLAVLVLIEISDVVFALDSIPAIFAVTTDPFIVYTSNIFAILGLRALYFLLAGVLERLKHLNVGLALVLVFVGSKMLLADIYKIPILLSLIVVAVFFGGSALASLRPISRRSGKEAQSIIPVSTDVR